VELDMTRIARTAVVCRLPFNVYLTAERAHVAQSVEHVLGKDEVTSSNLVVGSMKGTGGVLRVVGERRIEAALPRNAEHGL
jgi:hypothetical protein